MVENKYSVDEKDLTTPLVVQEVPERERVLTPEEEQRAQMERSSGITGAVIGFLLGGPILAAIAGFGAAYAVRKENAVGENARSLGKFGESVGEKAKELDRQHEISDKTKHVLGTAWSQVEKLDRNIAHKIQEFAANSWKASVAFTKENKLIERGIENTGRGFEYVSSKFST